MKLSLAESMPPKASATSEKAVPEPAQLPSRRLPVHLLHTLSIEVIDYLPAGRAAQTEDKSMRLVRKRDGYCYCNGGSNFQKAYEFERLVDETAVADADLTDRIAQEKFQNPRSLTGPSFVGCLMSPLCGESRGSFGFHM